MVIESNRRTASTSVVTDTSKSGNAKLRPVPVSDVTIDDAFWAPRMRINRQNTLPSQYRQLWLTGRFDNLLRVAGKHKGPFQGRYFNDTDVYKWIEAASWALASAPDPDLTKWIDEAIEIIEGAQRPDGYLDSYFELERAEERWTDHDLHEMYCAGHLIQAAVAHYRTTGSTRLLDVAIRFADHIDATFGPPESGKRIGTDGHPEIEMGLVELARVTGDRKYLDLAEFLVDVRGHGFLGNAYDRFGTKYHQDHQPFRDLDEIVGHAVRAVYLNAGVADIYLETGEAALGTALDRLWHNMTERKMYASGGIGSRYIGEAFGEDYELPNALAYTETCAAIGSAMWNWRMLAVDAEARFADIIELQLYNAMLAGVSLDGESYFYQNPLSDEGSHRRSEWFHVSCCPPNVARTLASLPGYLYSVSDSAIWAHFYAQNTANLTLPDGQTVSLRQSTNYPWNGEIEIEVQTSASFSLNLRIPGWCEHAALTVNGESIQSALAPSSYVEIERDWTAGDTITLSLPMPIRRIHCHPYVEENSGRVALMRGPLLYCVEQVDNANVDLRELGIADLSALNSEHRGSLLGGITVISGEAAVASFPAWKGSLYQPMSVSTAPSTVSPVSIAAIPYFAWGNREPGRMRVWLRDLPEQ